jgi:hypothetical protein
MDTVRGSHGGARRLRLVLPVVLAALVAACGGGGLGYDKAPAGFDPNSPKLAAANVNFDRGEIAVGANAPFVLVFENTEGVTHNVSIYADAAYQKRTFQGAMFSGRSTRWYPVPALAPGTYFFRCDLHNNMTGRLVAS